MTNPKATKTRVSVYMDTKDRERLDSLAKKLLRSRSFTVVLAVRLLLQCNNYDELIKRHFKETRK